MQPTPAFLTLLQGRALVSIPGGGFYERVWRVPRAIPEEQGRPSHGVLWNKVRHTGAMQLAVEGEMAGADSCAVVETRVEEEYKTIWGRQIQEGGMHMWL